jgi:hypothetical protein
MTTGIVHVLATIQDLQETAVDGIAAAKAAARGPFGLGALFAAVLKIAVDVKSLVADAPASMPEFADLDSTEVGQIGTAAYDCVKAVLVALAT